MTAPGPAVAEEIRCRECDAVLDPRFYEDGDECDPCWEDRWDFWDDGDDDE